MTLKLGIGRMGMKIYTNELGYMTNMATMPIYGKNLKKSSTPEQGFSEAQFGAGNRPLSQSRKQVNFPNFQLKKSQNMDENPNFTLAETYDEIAIRKTFLSEGKQPGRVAQSVGHLTRKSGVLGSIPGLATYFRFSFRFFKKGSCQLLAKVCARSTG